MDAELLPSLRLTEPSDGNGQVDETGPKAQCELSTRVTSAVPDVSVHDLSSLSRRRRGAGSSQTSRAVGFPGVHNCCCGGVRCLDDKALASIATLKKRGGHGPEGVLKSADTDMPTPVMRSQEEGHVPEGVQKSMYTDMPTHMKKTSW